jgi:valyl-tRNA synthetase
MAALAFEAVKSGEIKIIPSASEKEWYRWLEQPQDWCISRQLWWGHRVPAYFVLIEGDANDRSNGERWVSGRTLAEAKEFALKKFNFVSPSSIKLEQDEDVLDTWFSSGLWPFATLGWPNKVFHFSCRQKI